MGDRWGYSMSLSLEVRKFINSEQTGEYADVTLPAELPVEREELRAVRRDNAAAEDAGRAAAAIAGELAAAEKAKENISAALEEACKAEILAEGHLAEKQKSESEIQPEYEDKLSALNAAESEYEKAKAESEKLISAYKEAEKVKADAEAAYSAANSISAAKRAALSSANADAKSAAGSEAALTEKTESLRGNYAEAEITSEKAGGAAESAAREETKAAETLKCVAEQSVKLTGERKLLEKQFHDAEKNESKLNRELTRQKSAYEAAVQQCDALLARSETSQGTAKDKEAVKLKLGAVQSRANIFKTGIEEKQALYDTAVKTAEDAKAAFNECERRLAENAEQLAAARTEYEDAKRRTLNANAANTAEKAKFAALAAALADLTEQRQKSADKVSESKNTEQLAEEEAAAARAESERLKAVLEAAVKEAEAKKSVSDEASSVTNSAEKEYAVKKAGFDSVNSARENLKAAKEAAALELTEKQENVKRLENELSDIISDVERLKADASGAQAEAERLRQSVHVIQVKYEHTNIHYLETGKGEPVILIHGIGQSLYTFRKLIYKLAMDYRVIALDLAGHGYSGRPFVFEYGISDHAECIARFMDAAGIPSAHFLAFSTGAAYVLELAKLHPEKVEKLILLSPGGITPEMPLFVRMLENGLLGGIASKLYGLKNVRRLIDESLFDHTVITDDDVLEYYRPASDPDGRFAIRCSIGNYDEAALLASCRELNTETLIIWGADDKLHNAETVENYHSALQNSNFVKTLNSGHLIHEEKPDKVYSLIKNFIPAGYGSEDE